MRDQVHTRGIQSNFIDVNSCEFNEIVSGERTIVVVKNSSLITPLQDFYFKEDKSCSANVLGRIVKKEVVRVINSIHVPDLKDSQILIIAPK